MTTTDSSTSAPVIQMIPLDAISPSPLNPRKHFDDARLTELAMSIQQKGIRSPLQVRPGKKAKTFELIAGERRWTAASKINLGEAPCIVTEVSDDELVELALTENGQREDLTPMDEARAYQAAIKANPKHYTVAVVSGMVGKSESYVYRRLKLLELVKPLQEALDENRLSIAHAERLVKLTSDEQLRAAGIRNGKFNGDGVVWRSSPLFETQADKDGKPGLEDLQPLHALDNFIRNKTFFDPKADAVKYLQPGLAEDIDEAIDQHAGQLENQPGGEDAARDAARAALISVTTDSMARSRMGLKPNDPMPLVPSKWREVKPGKECEFTRVGVITHGSEARVLNVCTKKSCKKHWPVAKKTAPASKPAKSSAPAETWQQRQAREDAEREAKQTAWNQVIAEALPKLAEFTKGVVFSASLIRTVLENYQIDNVQKRFGVTLSEKTAAHVLLLATFNRVEWRDSFFTDVKATVPKFLPELQRIEAAQKKAAAAAAKVTTNTPAPTDAIGRTVLRALNIFQGGAERIKAAVLRGAKNEELDKLIRRELGQGAVLDDAFDFETRGGQLHINKPFKRKLTVGKVRDVARTLFGTTKRAAKKGKAA